jgi:hypothetical protein
MQPSAAAYAAATTSAAAKAKRSLDRALAGKLKQQAQQWGSLRKKTTALAAALKAEEARYDSSACTVFSSLRQQGDAVGGAMKSLQAGLVEAADLIHAQLLPIDHGSIDSGLDCSDGEQQDSSEVPAQELY